MPSTTRARSLSTPMLILAGVAAFGVALFALLSSTPSPKAHAQDANGDCTPDNGCPFTQNNCTQPSADGCPFALDSTVQATITDPSDTDNWLLNVQDTSDFTVTLTDLPADYQLYVYAPDNSLIGLSNNDGTADESVAVTNQGVGTYTVVVNSQNGDVSSDPYTLYASTVALTAVPVSSYDSPPASTTGGYRTAP